MSELFVLAQKERNRACDDESHTVASRENIYFPARAERSSRTQVTSRPLKPLGENEKKLLTISRYAVIILVRQVNTMNVNEIMQNKNLSKYRVAKNSGIPYMTLNDICSGKTRLDKCSADTVYKLSKELDVTMEELLAPYMQPRPAFELFKSNVCHRLKELGDIDFLIDTIESGDITTYYERAWYPESLYLLAMVDYISRLNDVPLCDSYNELRKAKLKSVVYPSGVIAAAAVSGDSSVKERAIESSIPEFMRFNIVESEVRNVN